MSRRSIMDGRQLQSAARDVEGELVERRLRWRNVAELAVAVPAFAGLMWALYEGLLAVLVVTADDFPQCPAIQPDKALLVLVTLAIATLAVASFVCLFRHRILEACGCMLIQTPLALAWVEVDGGAAGCLIG